MDIPFYVLLVAYLIGFGLFLLWTFFNLYHIVRFGLFDFTGKLNTFIFVTLACIILFLTALMLKDTQWFDTFPLLQSVSFDGLSNIGTKVPNPL
jgi:hypothetical protein